MLNIQTVQSEHKLLSLLLLPSFQIKKNEMQEPRFKLEVK